MHIRIAVIDDLEQDFSLLETQLEKWVAVTSHTMSVKHYSSSFQVLDDYETGSFIFDLLFLDIMLPNINGLELIKELQKTNPTILFLLTSSNKSYAETGYSVYAFDFLSKPVTSDRLNSAMERVINKLNTINTDKFVFDSGKQTYTIPYSDVVFFEGSGNYVFVHTAYDKPKMIRTTLKKLCSSCPSFFVRVNRNVIVSIAHVVSFTRESIKLDCDDIPLISLSKSAYSTLRDSFLRYN